MSRVIPDVQASKYVVKKNDTLASISMKTMGTADYYVIWSNNYEKIGNNANDIKAGMVLDVPRVSNDSESN